MAFTTWAALYTSMLDDLASGNWRVREYEFAGGKRTQYSSFDDFKAALEYVKQQRDAGDSNFVGRSYATNGGRG